MDDRIVEDRVRAGGAEVGLEGALLRLGSLPLLELDLSLDVLLLFDHSVKLVQVVPGVWLLGP